MSAQQQINMAFGLYNIEIQEQYPEWRKCLPEYEVICNKACEAVLDEIGIGNNVPEVHISILLTDDKIMQSLNLNHRGQDRPTNVLAFPSQPPISQKAVNIDQNRLNTQIPLFLGDVALSLDTINREVKEQRKNISDHVKHIVVHAILHLLGYDHETETDAAEMEALEIKVLSGIGVASPYKT